MGKDNILLQNLDHDYLKFIDKTIGRCISENHFLTELKPMLEQALAKKARLPGVCIIHLKHWAVKHQLDLIKLSELGIITSLDEFVACQQTVLAHYENDTRLRVVVKLLHKGINRLLSAWQQDKLANQELVQKFDTESVNILREQWLRNDIRGELAGFIHPEVKKGAEAIAQQWVAGTQDTIELDKLVKTAIINNYTTYPDDSIIKQQIDANRRKILLQILRSAKEDEPLVCNVVNHVQEEILDNIVNRSYDDNRDVMSNIVGLLPNGYAISRFDYVKPVEKCIEHWFKTGPLNAMGNEVGKLVCKKIADDLTKAVLPVKLMDDLLETAVSDLIKQAKNRVWSANGTDEITTSMMNIIKADLTKSNFSDAVDTRDNLLNGILQSLLTAWKKDELSSEKSSAIVCRVNQSLQQLQKDLSGRLYLSDEYHTLKKECGELRAALTEIQQLLHNRIGSAAQSNQVLERVSDNHRIFRQVRTNGHPATQANPSVKGVSPTGM